MSRPHPRAPVRTSLYIIIGVCCYETIIIIGDNTSHVTDVTDRKPSIINLIKDDLTFSTIQMAETLHVAKCTILRDINILKAKNIIARIGSEKTGHWEVMGNNEKS
ncbi:MAG: DeoR family transcriptional regulator [Bacteroidaceae bacterium]|nr:DeoR family transcriptional regulator [Bacteroidaceae bacterium]